MPVFDPEEKNMRVMVFVKATEEAREAPEPGETLSEAESELGINDWIDPETGAPEKGCYQADWQAETNPVLNKRSGPEGLDKYETHTPAKEQGCP